jgi:L-2-hydroxyglutarate oxidase LhgO
MSGERASATRQSAALETGLPRLFDFDVTVVGAGAVGLACGRAFAIRNLDVLVIEREAVIGQGVSSRNSEVIHAGLYYLTDSLKARYCVGGRRSLYSFLESRKVAHRKCGKLVVATTSDDLGRLHSILQQAEANGVEGMQVLSRAAVARIEPELHVAGALRSPESGVFDSHGYMLALQGEIEDRGGTVATRTPFATAEWTTGGGFRVSTGGSSPTSFSTRILVSAAGLQAQEVAQDIIGYPPALIPPRHLGKGLYFRLKGRAPFEALVYPPPIPGALGIHYRKDLGGQAIFGPSLSYVDTEDYTVDESMEVYFADYIKRFWPGLPNGALVPDYAGIRPKLHGPGEAQVDFRLDGPDAHGIDGLVALFGIESPGLTSSLAIGEAVADILS